MIDDRYDDYDNNQSNFGTAVLTLGSILTGLALGGTAIHSLNNWVQKTNVMSKIEKEADQMNPYGEYAGTMTMIKMVNDLTDLVKANLKANRPTTMNDLSQRIAQTMGQLTNTPVREIDQMSNQELLAALENISTQLDGILLQQITAKGNAKAIDQYYDTMKNLNFNDQDVNRVETRLNEVINPHLPQKKSQLNMTTKNQAPEMER